MTEITDQSEIFKSLDESKVIEEIRDKRSTFESRMSAFLHEFNSYADFYRMIAPNRVSNTKGLSNTIVSETTRSVETLSTMQFAMMTAQAPNFDVLSQRGDMDILETHAISSILERQMEVVEYNRKLLKGLRTLNLMGTVFFEEPWMAWPSNNGSPAWEANDFIPRSLNQTGFAPNTTDLALSDWIYTLDFVSPYRLRQLAGMDEMASTWNRGAIEEAVEMSKSVQSNSIPAEIQTRLSAAGYADFSSNMELMTYWGPLESQNIYEDYVVGILNGVKIVRLHKNPFVSKMRPFRSAHFIEFELEPYGYGIGKLTKRIQEDLNANRNRIQDIITFNLFHMWKMSRFAGIKPQQLKIRPWHVVEVDDMNGLEPLRSDLNAVTFGLKLEEILKDDFRSLTGATANLQAMVTEATATEARITQNEAVRRISVMTEILADRLLRQSLYFRHKCNMQLLDKDIWVRIAGVDKPVKVSPADIQKEVDFKLKITTDRDFRPKRTQQMIQFLQILTSLRNFVPPDIDVGEIIKELARDFGIHPNKIQKIPGQIGEAPVDQRLAQMQALGGLLSKEGALGETGIPVNNIGGTNANA